MSLVHRVAQSIGFIEFVFRRRDSAGDIFPSDAPVGTVDGTRPIRVLVIGESTAMGLGVATHSLAVAAQTARRLARITGRGVLWASVGFPDSRLRTAGAIDGSSFAGVDVVVVMAGIVDTLCVTPVAEWKRNMATLLDDLETRVPAHGQLVVAAIPPMDNAGSISRAARIAAGIHARRLNSATRSTASGRDLVDLVDFPAALTEDLWVPKSEQGTYRQMYSVWAEAFAGAIANRLRETVARG